jgi:FkbM family methyltransferase
MLGPQSIRKELMVTVSKISAILRPIQYLLRKDPDRFLRDISGVVHVGANTGQERELYKNFSLRVIWVEPIPDVFAELKENIKGFYNQRALQALVTDSDGKEYQFHIANNKGASSSILDFKLHKDIWPDVAYTSTISLKSITLTSLFQREQVDPCEYQALILDTQGSELLVLQGSVPILENFKYIKIEVPDFESYEGCCQLDDISAFMAKHGYVESSRKKFASRAAGGRYFDIVYRRKA